MSGIVRHIPGGLLWLVFECFADHACVASKENAALALQRDEYGLGNGVMRKEQGGTKLLLTVDIGGTFIKWAVADGLHLTDIRGKVPTPYGTFEDLVAAFAAIVEQLGVSVEGVAVSLPGTVDVRSGAIIQGGALQYANGCNLIEALGKRLGLPASIENDARCAMLAEHRLGSLKGTDDAVMIVIGTGIGGALISGGRLIRGCSGAAGELSLLVSRPLREKGGEGLLARRAGMRALLESAASALGRDKITGEELMGLVEAGDQVACEVLDNALSDLADAMVTLQFLLNPARFAIGGGISANDTYMSWLRSAYERAFDLLPFHVPHAAVVPATFRNDANLLGALVSFEDRVSGETSP